MTQEELRAKLESCDVENIGGSKLVWLNDDARDMVTNYEHMLNLLFAYTHTEWVVDKSDDVMETATKLTELIRDEIKLYDDHSARIEQELKKRLETK